MPGAPAAPQWSLASVWAGPQGAILTTDADSRVPPDWVAANRAAFETGVDAVLGRVALDEEGDALPDALHRRGALESAYEQALVEIAAWLDPRAHDPWPHHATISGANSASRWRPTGGSAASPAFPSARIRPSSRRSRRRTRGFATPPASW